MATQALPETKIITPIRKDVCLGYGAAKEDKMENLS